MAPQTRAARLDAIVRHVNAAAAQAVVETGHWDGHAPDALRRAAGAPYAIQTRPDGSRRVVVTSADGDSVAGVGATLEEAIAALERKVGLVEQEKGAGDAAQS